jgi:hypothetical protein
MVGVPFYEYKLKFEKKGKTEKSQMIVVFYKQFYFSTFMIRTQIWMIRLMSPGSDPDQHILFLKEKCR